MQAGTRFRSLDGVITAPKVEISIWDLLTVVASYSFLSCTGHKSIACGPGADLILFYCFVCFPVCFLLIKISVHMSKV